MAARPAPRRARWRCRWSGVALGSWIVASLGAWLAPLVGPAVRAAAAQPATQGSGQPVTLRIKPRVGDTLRMRLEQEIEYSGTTRVGKADTSMTYRESLLILSRTVVQASDESGTTVLNITDSVARATSGGRGGAEPPASRHPLQGKRVRMRVTPQGAAYVLEGPDSLSSALASMIAQMPATLPERAVAVGDTWSQDMRVPLARQPAATGSVVHATFRLDSLSRGGGVAHVSVRGAVSRDTSAARREQLRMSTSGDISGTLTLDRRRGWPTEATTTINMRAVVMPPRANERAQPMHVRTKITQRLRAMDE
jgi:hypothetical protein